VLRAEQQGLTFVAYLLGMARTAVAQSE
jgi:hypothetical protein